MTKEKYQGNTVEHWKQNAEEYYMTTPISVLKYITVLEEQAKQKCTLVEIDREILETCIAMYKSGEKLTAIKWLIEEAKLSKYTFGIKWAQKYFESLEL